LFIFTDSPTPFDIRFRLFGFPCRVSGLFWLGALFLGNSAFTWYGAGGFALWTGCVFVSILVHELGHAFACRAFHARVTSVTLSMLGGYCSFEEAPRARWKRIVISLAGPAAGFALLGFVLGLNASTGWARPSPDPRDVDYPALALHFFWWINLVWGLVNLIPVWPLDGGQVCRELCTGARIARPIETSLWISIVTAGSIALLTFAISTGSLPRGLMDLFDWLPASIFTAIWFALFALENFQLLQQQRYEHRSTYGGRGFGYSDDGDAPWRRRG
jgi:Zn-dependent protease